MNISVRCIGGSLVSIMSFSDALFMLSFENISVYSFIPGDRKWALEAMPEALVEAAVTSAAVAAETAASER